jgi:hypothetical protein
MSQASLTPNETQHAVSEPGGDRQARSDAPLRLVSDGHNSDPTLVQSKCHDKSPDRQQTSITMSLERKAYAD